MSNVQMPLMLEHTGQSEERLMKLAQVSAGLHWDILDRDEREKLSKPGLEQALENRLISVWTYYWAYVARVIVNTLGVHPSVFQSHFSSFINDQEFKKDIRLLKYALSREAGKDVGVEGARKEMKIKIKKVMQNGKCYVQVQCLFPYIAVEEGSSGEDHICSLLIPVQRGPFTKLFGNKNSYSYYTEHGDDSSSSNDS